MSETNGQQPSALKNVVDELPLDRLKDEFQDVLKALGERTLEGVTQRVTDATDSLQGIADNGGVVGKAAGKGAEAAAKGESPVKGALKGGLGGVKDKVKSVLPGGSSNTKGATKSTNIIEEIDIGAPIDVVYDQWTQFQDYSGFMKKVDNVEQEEDTKLNFKAQVFWSHRSWEATILEQVPDERIIWRSQGEKGHVDGAVTFHELAPELTRVLVVLEYYPQGFMERTGNIWRAQGQAGAAGAQALPPARDDPHPPRARRARRLARRDPRRRGRPRPRRGRRGGARRPGRRRGVHRRVRGGWRPRRDATRARRRTRVRGRRGAR